MKRLSQHNFIIAFYSGNLFIEEYPIGEFMKRLKINGKVIAFSGIDGSGKSVHARKVASLLRSQHKTVNYVWTRGVSKVFVSFPILAFCRISGITKVHSLENGLETSEYQFYACKPIRCIWPWLQLIDALIYKVASLVSSIQYYDFVIMDRSVIDTFVDVVADTYTLDWPSSFQILLISLLPKDSVVIILDTSENMAMQRKQDIYNVCYLNRRRKLYEYLAKQYDWTVISTELPFDEVHQVILNSIASIGKC